MKKNLRFSRRYSITNFAVTDRGIYFISSARPASIQFFSFSAASLVTLLKFRGSLRGFFSVTGRPITLVLRIRGCESNGGRKLPLGRTQRVYLDPA